VRATPGDKQGYVLRPSMGRPHYSHPLTVIKKKTQFNDCWFFVQKTENFLHIYSLFCNSVSSI